MKKFVLASLFYHPYDQTIRELWRALREDFSLEGVPNPSMPYFIWQKVCSGTEDSFSCYKKISQGMKPFEVRTVGLGARTGKTPQFYIPLVKSPLLQQYHECITNCLREENQLCHDFVDTDEWNPQIPLVDYGLTPEKVYEIMLWLPEQNLNWVITIDHIAILNTEETGDGFLVEKFPFPSEP